MFRKMKLNRLTAISVLACVAPFYSHAAEEVAKTGTISLEEIVVTAQKREESLQATPISVTAFSETDLQNKNIDNIANIAEFTPNLIFDETAPLSGASSAAVLFHPWCWTIKLSGDG